MSNAALSPAIARFGIEAQEMTLISPLGQAKGRRWAYRLTDSRGRIFKVRVFESESVASRVVALRKGLDAAFAPVLDQCGPVVLEEWIVGTPWSQREQQLRISEAGEILGRLHANNLRDIRTEPWLVSADADMAQLVEAGVLSGIVADRLAVMLRDLDPGHAINAITHLDFCADNILVDEDDRLRIIDNELFETGPVGFDLGRTFHLWPMSESERTAFMEGYLYSAGRDPGESGFWRVVASLQCARVFLRRDPVRLESSLLLLRQLMAEQHSHSGVFSARDSLVAHADPESTLRSALQGAKAFLERHHTTDALASVVTRRDHISALRALATDHTHLGFIVCASSMPSGRIHSVCREEGFETHGECADSLLLARELSCLTHRAHVPTTIITATLPRQGAYASGVELFIPDADDRLVKEWIRDEIGTHIAMMLTGIDGFWKAHHILLEEGFRVPSFMGSEPEWIGDTGWRVMFHDKIHDGRNHRVELLVAAPGSAWPHRMGAIGVAGHE